MPERQGQGNDSWDRLSSGPLAATNGTGKQRADGEPDGHGDRQKQPDDDEDDHADRRDRGVLAPQISLRALAHGARNLLHPRRASVGREHLSSGPDPVTDREQAAQNNEIDHEVSFRPKAGR